MAIAGEGIPACQVEWRAGVLRSVGRTQHVPVRLCYSRWGCGCGTLEEAAGRLLEGEVVRLDLRGDSYLRVEALCREGERA